MNTPRADQLAALFPKWEATPEILEWAEDLLKPFSAEQVKFAARQHKTERGKAYDPDVGELVRRLKGTGQRHAVQQDDPKAAMERYNNQPNTAEDTRWCQMLDSWRLQLGHDMKQPGFSPNDWARANYRQIRDDVAPFRIDSPVSIAYVIRLIGRDCGVKFTPKAQPTSAGPLAAVVGVVMKSKGIATELKESA